MLNVIKIPVSVMVFTLNEEVNLPHCLNSLKEFDDIVVVDSFSSDKTCEIANEYGARLFQNEFEGFGKQRNWAIENTNPQHKWILVLDADERPTDELIQEIRKAVAAVNNNVAAFRLKRRFYMWGRWLKYSSGYPTWVVRLIHKEKVKYINRGHAETQECKGKVLELKEDLIDENRKGIDEWFERQNFYARKEADYELSSLNKGVSFLDIFSLEPLKRRHAFKKLSWQLPFRSFFFFVYSYFIRGGMLDGHAGFVFCSMKSIFQATIEAKKRDYYLEQKSE